MPKPLLLALPLALAVSAASAETVRSERATFRVTPVAGGLENPWGLAILPDGRMLVTERPGRVRLVGADGRLSDPLAGTPGTVANRQGGMLDVVLHPRFAENGFVYICHVTEGQGGTSSTITRLKLEGERFSEPRTILSVTPRVGNGLHFGCRMAFGQDGMLFAGFGDRFQMDRAQDLGDLNGKIIRLADDGAVPQDNPFVGRQGARPEIWSWGHRNIQGLLVDPATGALWAHEHGPQGGDEVNLIRRGANYGWPRTTHGVNYGGATITDNRSLPGMEDALKVWVPSIAPSGFAAVAGDAFPAWRGNLLVGALRDRSLVRLTREGDRITGEERISMFGERIREVRVAPDGRVYLLTDSREGAIWRLDPA
ncbi:PQQ-dependent sugar dehydrogenase [Elioraea rosea]|uniref:PQQ-dependent sugar dehydrogenase n=1 Tax=Elioraea rosea TaxID=2492390 RepID=UPI0011835093|nr:PQQ-dependent sugar dehydrogenase [Elioraea rosea]